MFFLEFCFPSESVFIGLETCRQTVDEWPKQKEKEAIFKSGSHLHAKLKRLLDLSKNPHMLQVAIDLEATALYLSL